MKTRPAEIANEIAFAMNTVCGPNAPIAMPPTAGPSVIPAQANAPAAKASQLYIHAHQGRAGRSIDDSTERFVDATRIGASG